MTEELFTLRDARAADKPTLDAYCIAEGMDVLPSVDLVRVAVNADDEIVGFIRIALSEEGVAFVNPVITYDTWRGYGVGRALMDDALDLFGELRLVSRGTSIAFYEALGYERIPWDAVEMTLVEDCDGCAIREECGPVPMRKAVRS